MKPSINKKELLSRLKDVNGFISDTELANFLDINKSTLSNWYSRNSIDYELVFSKSEHVNLNWLFTGQGEMLRQLSTNQVGDFEEDERINELKDMIAIQKERIKDLEKLINLK